LIHARSALRSADPGDLARPVRQIEGVMGDDDFCHCRRHLLRQGGDAGADRIDLGPVDAATFEAHGAGGVDADDGDLVIDESRLQVVTDAAPVVAERLQRALQHSVKRHIVIAGNDHLRRGQAKQKGPRLAELFGPCALGQVARHHDAIGPLRVHGGNQGINDCRVGAAEVKI